MKKTLAGLSVLAALASMTAHAQDQSNFYAGARVGASFFENSCDSISCKNQEVAGGLIFGYDFANGFGIESTFDYLGHFQNQSVNTEIYTGDLSAITLAPKFNLHVYGNTSAYAKAGAAWWNWNSSQTGDLDDFTYMAALGLEYRANDLVNFRAEYQYMPDVKSNYTNLTAPAGAEVNGDSHFFNAGVTFHFGRAPVIVAPVEEYVPVEEVVEVVEPVEIVLPSLFAVVQFGFDMSNLTGQAAADLGLILERLQTIPETTVSVDGYTDSTGSVQFNEQLSLERAQSVSQYFSNNGISATRIYAQGHGPANPVASNDTAEGRAMNRRVEVSTGEIIMVEEQL